MGCCSSKPNNPSSTPSPHQTKNPNPQPKSTTAPTNPNKQQGEEKKPAFKKKEVFVIQHRRSHDKIPEPKGSSSDSDCPDRNPKTDVLAMAASGAAVRTSSCTKEEVDAILIQCGRLSRSSSGARKYSGSKRSHDFDREIDVSKELKLNCGGGGVDDEDEDDGRLVRRHSRGSHRRRTPSRSRERELRDQRSGSRERSIASGGGSRRVSRSPRRRSDSPVTSNSVDSGGGSRPGKMVSVPAVEKSGNGGGDCNVKRVLVRRTVGEGSTGNSRGGTPPRSRSSAARSSGGVDAGGVASLSRSSSRKAENSPYRRASLNEIDFNSLPFQPLANGAGSVKGQQRSCEIEEVAVKQPVNVVSQDKLGVDVSSAKVAVQGGRSRGNEVKDIAQINYCRVNENPPHTSFEQLSEDNREQSAVSLTTQSGVDSMKLPLTLMRSRSSRRSRDLDINVEALMNPNPATNYNLLLLQDIKNFHQKTSATAVSDTNPSAESPLPKTPFSLPECLSKACSIVEEVADLNSSTKPNCADDRQRTPLGGTCRNDSGSFSYVTNSVGGSGQKRVEKSKIPFIDSEVNGEDSLIEPSMHKYVTVRKRGTGFESFQGGDFDELESSGSNSYTSGSRHQGVSSSSWEPNSADSTDRWTSKSREGVSPLTLERLAFSKVASDIHEDPEKKLPSNRGRELSDRQQRGLSRSTLGGGR